MFDSVLCQTNARVDYNSQQSAIYGLRTLNSRSVLALTNIVTDHKTIAKAQLNIHMRTHTRRSATPRKASWPARVFVSKFHVFTLCEPEVWVRSWRPSNWSALRLAALAVSRSKAKRQVSVVTFQKWQSQQEKEDETLTICNKATLRVCGARRAGSSKTRFVGLRTSLLPGLPAPPTRSWATSLTMRTVTSISCRCLYCVLSKQKPRIVLPPHTFRLLRAYCPSIDRFRREWGRSLTFATCWQKRTYPFVSIQQSMS